MAKPPIPGMSAAGVPHDKHTGEPIELKDGNPPPGSEAIAVGSPVSFPGGITSLWASPDENGAVAVTHNAETGKYEAYLLTMACSQ